MAQQIRAFAVLPQDRGLVLSTYVGQFTTTHFYISRGSNTLFWPLKASTHMGIYIGTHTHK